MNGDPKSSRAASGDPTDAGEPSVKQVWDFLLYGTSLPERVLRSTSAMIGGVLRETTELLVPQAFRSSQSYSIFVQQMIDFMAHNVGGVDRTADQTGTATEVENYVARKTVGNFIELAGLATLHISPLTVLAVVSDVAYGSQTYLRELAAELKREGVIPEDSTINHANDLLDALREASGATAQAFDLPPTSIDGLKQTINQTRDAVSRLDPTTLFPQAEIDRLWAEMHRVADQQNVSLLGLGGAVSLYAVDRLTDLGVGTLSAVRVAGNLFESHVLTHYAEGLKGIGEKGIYVTLSEMSAPYSQAVWRNFSMEQATITEDLLSGRLTGRLWQQMGAWLKAPPGNANRLGEEPMDSEDGLTPGPLEVSIDGAVQGLAVAIIEIADVQVRDLSEVDRHRFTTQLASTREVGSAGGEERRQAVRSLLRRGGFRPAGRNKPAQEYLLGTLQRDGSLPSINNAVDVLNVHSVVTGLPISLLSLSRAPGPWMLRYGLPEEAFVFNQAGQELQVEGLIVIAAGESGAACGSPVKDSKVGKIDESDSRFALCIYAPQESLDLAALKTIASELAEEMVRCCGGCCVNIQTLVSGSPTG